MFKLDIPFEKFGGHLSSKAERKKRTEKYVKTRGDMSKTLYFLDWLTD